MKFEILKLDDGEVKIHGTFKGEDAFHIVKNEQSLIDWVKDRMTKFFKGKSRRNFGRNGFAYAAWSYREGLKNV